MNIERVRFYFMGQFHEYDITPYGWNTDDEWHYVGVTY